MNPCLEMTKPLFSVIIPTFNRAHLISRAIKSVVAQTFASFELIIVDDGSTDETASVVGHFSDDRIHYIQQENQGRCAARNAGVAVAKGEYVTFLDSDDEALPDWLEALSVMCRSPECGIVCCGAISNIEPGDKRKRKRIHLPRVLSKLYQNQKALFLAGTFAVRADIFREAGGYFTGLSYGENSELALRLIPACLQFEQKLMTVSKPLLIFHASRAIAGEADFKSRLESAELILRLHGNRYRKKSPRAYANHCGIAGVNAARLGLKSKARKHFWASVCADPVRPKHYMRLLFSLFPPLGKTFWTRYNKTTADKQSLSI